MDYESQFKGLRIFNLVMGCFHLAQAVAIFFISNNFSLPVTTSFLKLIPATGRLGQVIEPMFNIPLGPGIALFLLMSAIAHFTIASPGVFPWYARNLKKGINYARWYEYSLSASVMIVLIAMLCGIYDFASLLMAFFLTSVMNLCGLIMEVHNQTTTKTDWTSYIVGCIAGVVPWIAIAVYFIGSVTTAEGKIPTFVFFVLPTLFIFFFCFAVNMVLQYKKVGPWKNYVYGEQVYVILSLVAKSALAWQVFAGTLRPV